MMRFGILYIFIKMLIKIVLSLIHCAKAQSESAFFTPKGVQKNVSSKVMCNVSTRNFLLFVRE